MSYSTPTRHSTRALVGVWVFMLADTVGFVALLTTVAALQKNVNRFGMLGDAPDMMAGWLGCTMVVMICGCLGATRRFATRRTLFLVFAALIAVAFATLRCFELLSTLGNGLIAKTPEQESYVVVSIFHLLHVVGGIVQLVLLRSHRDWPVPGELEEALGNARCFFATTMVYWYFVTGQWILIFVFFYLR